MQVLRGGGKTQLTALYGFHTQSHSLYARYLFLYVCVGVGSAGVIRHTCCLLLIWFTFVHADFQSDLKSDSHSYTNSDSDSDCESDSAWCRIASRRAEFPFWWQTNLRAAQRIKYRLKIDWQMCLHFHCCYYLFTLSSRLGEKSSASSCSVCLSELSDNSSAV